MKQSLTVHVPQTENVSYTLYAVGIKTDKPQLTSDESEYIFRFMAGTPVVLFYCFGKMKKAFVVKAWGNNSEEEPIVLPGVDEKLTLIYMTKGNCVKKLDGIIKKLTKDDENEIFTFPALFWYRLTSIIQFKNSKPTLINGLYNLYSEKTKKEIV